jgi:hypothetical protein
MASPTMIAETAARNGQPELDELESRVQRLEDVVAALCDTQALEERITSRVAEQLARRPPEESPAAVAPPAPVAEHAAAPGPTPAAASRSAWGFFDLPLLGDVWWDLRMTWRLLRDPLYQVSWIGRLVPLAALAYLVIGSVWAAVAGQGIPVLNLLDDLVVTYIGLKVLGREVRRYHDFALRRYH